MEREMEICVGILFIVGFAVFAKLMLDYEHAVEAENEPDLSSSSGYAVYRQMHGYGVNPHPTDMHTSVNANLYDFPNGPKH
jgi:hypothetical protein